MSTKPSALSADDSAFGQVRVTWNGTEARNLFTSTLILENDIGIDLSNLGVTTHTNDTVLLTERLEVEGSVVTPRFSEEYLKTLKVLPDGEPTPSQMEFHAHRREYIIPVLNRGQRLILRYLTSVPTSSSGPAVFLEVTREGILTEFRRTPERIYGTPVSIARGVGLLVCLLVWLLAVLLIREPWIVASVAMISGLTVQALGAMLYKVLVRAKSLFIE